MRNKVYGSSALGEKVTGQNPKVAKQDRKRKPRGRTHKRMELKELEKALVMMVTSSLLVVEFSWSELVVVS
ncbi:hypothetical protein C5167_040897 [Papaver somniferum]|uniref:40S ribosomal protein S30 n=1 Tax=Papaver somniferum TaxID=3469 RepID=A0A4Y7IKE2_PAPSO|nr:hypothetical protein C5167_040897 [Papaver somniferum]